MIVSRHYRFIFIKTVKTADTSVEVVLSRVCGPDDVVTPVHSREPGHKVRNHRGAFNPVIDLAVLGARSAPGILKRFIRAQRFYNHMPARLLRARLGEAVWRSYFKFTIERDPWEKTLSFFHMAKARGETPTSLVAFLAAGRFPPASELYTDRHGRILVDRVLRYESLDTELRDLPAQRGIAQPGALPSAKGGYRRDHREAAEILTAAQARKIAERYAFEIEDFGYRLERTGQ